MVRRRGRVLVAAACVLLAAVSAVAVPAPGPPDAAASTVLAQPANCPGIGITPTTSITVGGTFNSEVWYLLCNGTIELSELRTTGGGYRFDPGHDVSQAHLLTWMNRLSGDSMGGLTYPGFSFDNSTYIQRGEAAASFVTALGLTRSQFGLPTGFDDVPACASASDSSCHKASRHIRALFVCQYMVGWLGVDAGKFKPSNNLSRGQAAAVIHRKLKRGCATLKVQSVTVDTVNEGETATVTVNLSRSVGAVQDEFDTVWVGLRFEEGTATEFDDYDPPLLAHFLGAVAWDNLIFTTGQSSKTTTVDALTDLDASEGDETYIVRVEPSGIPSDVAQVTAVIRDAAAPGVVVDPTSVTVDEGSSNRTYEMKLAARPAADVVVTIVDPTDNTDVSASPAELTFTTSNWARDQSVTVSSAQDTTTESGEKATITHTAASSDGNYRGIAVAAVKVYVTDDDDPPGVVVDPTSVTVDEGSSNRTYRMKLAAQPAANVVVTIVDPTVNTDVTAYPAQRTFTTSNWAEDQSVTVSSAQDTITESGEKATITHTAASSDGNYDGIAVDDVKVYVTDDDTAGVVITPTVLTVNEGATGTYRVRLGAEPSSSVTVTINDPTGNPDVSASPSTRTFSTTTWDRDQTVTVFSAQDTIAETNETATVTHTVTSLDGRYDNIGTTDVVVWVTDDDSPGVILSATSATIEEGKHDLYKVRLANQPSASVTVAANDPADNNQVFIADSYETLTFTTSNWDSDQYVVFGSIEDTTYEAGGETATITHTVTSADSGYNGTAVTDFDVTVTDNDPAPVVTIVNVVGDNDPTVYTPPPPQNPPCPSGWHRYSNVAQCTPDHEDAPSGCAGYPQDYVEHQRWGRGHDYLTEEPCPPPPTCHPQPGNPCPPPPPPPPDCSWGFHLDWGTCYEDHHDPAQPCRLGVSMEWEGWSGHYSNLVRACPLPVPYDTSLLVNTAGDQLTLRLQVDVSSAQVEPTRTFRVSATNGSAVNGTHFDLPTTTLTFNSANPTREIVFDTTARQSHGTSPRSFTIVVQDTHVNRGHARITLAPRINPPAIGRQ